MWQLTQLPPSEPERLAAIEEALFAAARGGFIEESREHLSGDNEQLKRENHRKYVPGNVRAQLFILANRCPGRWRARPDAPARSEQPTVRIDLRPAE